MTPLLEVEKLSVSYKVPDGEIKALRDVSLQISPGKIVGLVGESGSGKTTLALSILRHLPSSATMRSGSLRFDGQALVDREVMRSVWGSQIAYVSQDPASSLNPSIRVGDQLGEILRFHLSLSRTQVRQQVLELLRMVELADPGSVAERYPHQLSGGMQQRVLIAMALGLSPKLVILDEPTSNLDSTIQATMLDLLQDLIRDRNLAALFITHNLGLVAQICDQVVVLYAGEVVEWGPAQAIFGEPLNPYTSGLLRAVPRLGETGKTDRLPVMAGRIPNLEQVPVGCIFKDRCPLAESVCDDHPPLYPVGRERATRCHRWEEMGAGDLWPRKPVTVAKGITGGAELLDLDHVSVVYPRARQDLPAVNRIDFEIPESATVGLVGESGSGKTTLARAIVGLIPTSNGEIRLRNQPLSSRIEQRSMEHLREIQMVFQNTDEALNPHQTVGQILRRAFQVMLGQNKADVDEQVHALLESVQLSAEHAHRHPHQLSGGERQRVAIARATVSQPSLLIADEAVSSLDASVQIAVLNLLLELKGRMGSATLFISHDLAAVGYLADVIAVIYQGMLMEIGAADHVFNLPHHPYTHALLSAVPQIDPTQGGDRIRLREQVTHTDQLGRGCPFHNRCPFSLGDVCKEQEPPWRELPSGKRYFCHLTEEELLDHEIIVRGG